MVELELKAVAPDPDALRARLLADGATLAFDGRLHDRRYDREGMLRDRNEVLRIRRHVPREGAPREELAWKGPTTVRDGYKAREELAVRIAGTDSAEPLLAALGYRTVHTIDRHVEVYRVADAEVRMEWYPELDTLVEVEGTPAAIEAAVEATGLPRAAFRAAPLDAFMADYHFRTGRQARVALGISEEPLHWPA